MPPENEKSAPSRKAPPAFGARPGEEEGLATGLGVAQPTETDKPEAPAAARKP